MRYLPHTNADVVSMLEAIGVRNLEDLFSTVPEECRKFGELELPEPLSEWELCNHVEGLADTTSSSAEWQVYLGAGNYQHFIPAVVPYLLSRSEFSTAYTPYQPEMSQGTLQAIFEYQTLTARLLGMEVANASLYDGASALAEALLMAIRVTRREKVALSRLIHPHYRQVAETYLHSAGYETVELPYEKNGRTDLSLLDGNDEYAAVAVQSPNFLGCIEDIGLSADVAHAGGALSIVAFSEPLAFGLLKSPGSQGADIACGEGQGLGIPQSFGGPGLGMFACNMQYVRNMPGRLVGQTLDVDGKRGFVLTLATREQHIRRERATSNICTNNSLCALAATMYMASLGKNGIRELACLNRDKAEYLKTRLRDVGFKSPFEAPTFNEFTVEVLADFDVVHKRLIDKRIVAGLPLGMYYPELERHFLLCVTEVRTKQDLDELVKEIAS